ncbi:hypothetical protein EVG20_g11418 [Dentipellis fragilis]|uniref:Uncharacterized protein n=1 Tax=Dentipellis fragilis TaxID=205917 RepID=A0A4Y9XKV1_9AGAM|nr:hypothetical protein EVG20_g11418 [Dentipellis fragilis]
MGDCEVRSHSISIAFTLVRYARGISWPPAQLHRASDKVHARVARTPRGHGRPNRAKDPPSQSLQIATPPPPWLQSCHARSRTTPTPTTHLRGRGTRTRTRSASIHIIGAVSMQNSKSINAAAIVDSALKVLYTDSERRRPLPVDPSRALRNPHATVPLPKHLPAIYNRVPWGIHNLIPYLAPRDRGKGRGCPTARCTPRTRSACAASTPHAPAPAPRAAESCPAPSWGPT